MEIDLDIGNKRYGGARFEREMREVWAVGGEITISNCKWIFEREKT